MTGHISTSLFLKGHYVTSVKKFTSNTQDKHSREPGCAKDGIGGLGGSWVQFDDSLSTPVLPERVASSAAEDGYILFFTST